MDLTDVQSLCTEKHNCLPVVNGEHQAPVANLDVGDNASQGWPGNPYDGHTLKEQLEQTGILLEDVGVVPRHVMVDLGFRGVDRDNPKVQIIHRGKAKSLNRQQRRWLKRRQALEPTIGHLKSDHRMDRCWLAGSVGDALHTVLCAAGYNLRWLMRAVARLGLKGFFALVALSLWVCLIGFNSTVAVQRQLAA